MDAMAIMYDLDDLKSKIEAAGTELRDGAEDEEEDILTPIAISVTPLTVENDFQEVVRPNSERTTKVSRLSNLRSKFRFARKSSNVPTIGLNLPPVSPNTILECSIESQSVASETTLVECVPYHNYPKRDDTRYLTLLAPLVATLQRLRPLIQQRPDHALRASFLKRCDELSDLLKELKQDTLFSSPSPHDEETDDMRLLLLNALHRKVILEQARCAAPRPVQPTTLGTIEETPNPFILHSSSLGATSSFGPRTPSPPKPIALAPPVYDQAHGSLSDFMGHSQQTWRMNVHRLGRFQASALFSPSPIAVNRAMKIGATRL